MYSNLDIQRENDLLGISVDNHPDYRSAFRHDYGRLIHCPSFRRLAGKTQLYPVVESDFFRNRLTHSLEVAQIAKSITLKIINENFFPLTEERKKRKRLNIDTDLVEFSAMAHDLGHPPFGHVGERALHELMKDSGGFEGNAQTFRILSRLEKKCRCSDRSDGRRLGLNLCFRSLASIVKDDTIINSDKIIAKKKNNHFLPVKGIYETEETLLKMVKDQVTGRKNYSGSFLTIEASIMDIADDIAYATYDIEDSFKSGFLTYLDLIFGDLEMLDKTAEELNQKIGDLNFDRSSLQDVLMSIFQFNKAKLDIPRSLELFEFADIHFGIAYTTSQKIAEDGYFRVPMTAHLVDRFINGISFSYNSEIPALSCVKLKDETRLEVEVLKRCIYESQIQSSQMQIAEFRGKEIINKIFEVLYSDDGFHLMPKDYHRLYNEGHCEREKMRIVCDFIAGMTDRYAIEFYGRLTSENPQTIFKPY